MFTLFPKDRLLLRVYINVLIKRRRRLTRLAYLSIYAPYIALESYRPGTTEWREQRTRTL